MFPLVLAMWFGTPAALDETPGAPPPPTLDCLKVFPGPEEAEAKWDWAWARQEYLEEARYWVPRSWRPSYQAAFEYTERAQQCWWNLMQAQRDWYDTDVRRYYLGELRDLIGPANFALGRMPPPTDAPYVID